MICINNLTLNIQLHVDSSCYGLYRNIRFEEYCSTYRSEWDVGDIRNFIPLGPVSTL